MNLIILLISLEYLVLAAVFFTFKRAPSLSLEFKVANVIKIKKKQSNIGTAQPISKNYTNLLMIPSANLIT